MLSHGLPILTNKTNPLFYELYKITDSLYPISIETIESDLNKYLSIKNTIKVSEDSFKYLQDTFNWEVVLEPLKNYIKIF
jgi:hypothetical protein